jgi:hypothetical protein
MPLVDCVGRYFAGAGKIHGEDIPVPVLAIPAQSWEKAK